MEHQGQYFIPQDLKTKPMIFRNIGLSEFFVMLFTGMFAYILAGPAHLVLNALQVPFIIYCVLVAIIMEMPSPWNKGKKIYQSLQFAATRNRSVYARIYPQASDVASVIHVPIVSRQQERVEAERSSFSPLLGGGVRMQIAENRDIRLFETAIDEADEGEKKAEKVEVKETSNDIDK